MGFSYMGAVCERTYVLACVCRREEGKRHELCAAVVVVVEKRRRRRKICSTPKGLDRIV